LRDRREGFTLIELLVVVGILGILAAIAVPVFLHQRAKSYEAQVQTNLKNAATAIESYASDPGVGGSYAGLDSLTGADLAPYGFRMPEYLDYLTIESNATEFCIEVSHSSLTDDSAWRRAIYDSYTGHPVATPDHCPKLV
jgi:type IV pilus assembly protein PilA